MNAKKYKKNYERCALYLKGVNPVLLLVVFAIFFASNAIRAQVNLYDRESDDVAGINALMSAVANNDVNGVRFFAKAGRALINQKNFGGATALLLASREGNYEIAKILIENGADIDVADNEGWTPLMRASLSGDKDIVDLLIKNNANAASVNSVGESAIIHASISNCSDCLNSMFEKFNFMKLMDIKLLKEQLTDAFVIARNHENKVTQGLLESYLDQTVKSEPLVEKQAQAGDNLQEKTFKIVVKKEDKTEDKEPPIPTVKQDDKRILAQVRNEKEQVPPQQTAAQEIHKHIYKFINSCDCASQIAQYNLQKAQEEQKIPQEKQYNLIKPEAKNFPQDQQKQDDGKEVIFLIQKNDQSAVKSGSNSKFKFSSGAKGKVIKIKKPQADFSRNDKVVHQVLEEQKKPKVEAKPQLKVESLIKETPKKIEKEVKAIEAKIEEPKILKPVESQSQKPVAITPVMPPKISTSENKINEKTSSAKFVIGVLPTKEQPTLAKPEVKSEATTSPQKIEKSVIIDLTK